MSGNSIGQSFVVTTFGESHGVALGCIVDGCPPGMELSEADIQGDLDRRRPGRSRHTTQRKEADQVKILSGVFEGLTTGTPIGLLIEYSSFTALFSLWLSRMYLLWKRNDSAGRSTGPLGVAVPVLAY